MSIHLSPRLLAAARAVPAGSRVIDVGTDHARLPVWLAQTGRAVHVWAGDIRPGPLAGAARLIEAAGVGDRVELRLADGLSGFAPADGNVIVITGMGGETIASILAAAPWVRGSASLILSPQTKQNVLRRRLRENGFSVTGESLVKDAGRVYPIILAGAGKAPDYTPAELYTGLFDQISADPLFREYLAGLKKRAEAAVPFDWEAEALLAQYESMEARL